MLKYIISAKSNNIFCMNEYICLNIWNFIHKEYKNAPKMGWK
jgi:hypothetical protein